MANAIYALSADPIHYGHIDIVKRGAKLFEKVTVAIGSNPAKNYLFTAEERAAMAKEALWSVPNAEVVTFNGLLVAYAHEHQIPVVLKGVRNADDAAYELNLHNIGDSQHYGIETCILPGRQSQIHFSSSAVKELQKYNGFVQEFVPLCVKQRLEERLCGQYVVGITGAIGAGKSYSADKLVEAGAACGVTVHNIDLDKIGHNVLSTYTEPLYLNTREEIGRCFPGTFHNGVIDRQELGKYVFGSAENKYKLDSIMGVPMKMAIQKEMYGKKGVLLLNGALLAEFGWMDACNNNCIVVRADAATQEQRLRKRGLDEEQIARRIQSQYTAEQKLALFGENTHKQHYGKQWVVDTSGNKENDYVALLEDVLHEMKR
jgi:pantetheine-phosphate adenylyltransferase